MKNFRFPVQAGGPIAVLLALSCSNLVGGDRNRDFSLWLLKQSRTETTQSEQAYFAALQAADSTAFRREFEAEFLILLPEREKQLYASLATLEGRKNFLARYWKAANPNPLLRENDWLLDFLKRRAYARKNFPAPEPPFMDDRGKYYLKYGKPLRRYEDYGAHGVWSNETWSYENITRNFVVHFKREGKVYREIKDLVELLPGNRHFDPFTEAKVLIAMARQRAAVSPVFERVFSTWLDLNSERLNPQSFPASHAPLTIETHEPHALLFSAAQYARTEIAHAHSSAPPSARDGVNAVNKIEFSEDYAQFREANGETRLEITVRAPLKNNLVKGVTRASKDSLRLEYAALFSDSAFNPVSSARSLLETTAGLAAAHRFPNAVGKLVLKARPQNGDLSLQIKDEREGRLGFARKDFSLRDFSGAALMLSDIQLLLEVQEKQTNFLPATMKQERLVAPYPFDTVRKTLPVLCYFEIYNLRASNYELTYAVTAAKGGIARGEPDYKSDKDAAAISVTTTRLMTNAAAEELLALDLSRLKNGAYYLEVRVSAAGGRPVFGRARKQFVITD